MRHKRRELLEQATLVWSLQDLDAETYLADGTIETTGRGGPVQLDPHMQARVDAEVARIRAENPDLPKFRGLS